MHHSESGKGDVGADVITGWQCPTTTFAQLERSGAVQYDGQTDIKIRTMHAAMDVQTSMRNDFMRYVLELRPEARQATLNAWNAAKSTAERQTVADQMYAELNAQTETTTEVVEPISVDLALSQAYSLLVAEAYDELEDLKARLSAEVRTLIEEAIFAFTSEDDEAKIYGTRGYSFAA